MSGGARTSRVVVVGNGMAGARLVEELRAPGSAGRVVTVFGDEPSLPYNRVLLSELLAGRTRATALALLDSEWYSRHDVDARLGVRVTSVDREARTVTADDGTTTAYDVLVLASGSTAFVPPVPGLHDADGQLLAGVAAFRTLADCQRIDAVAGTARAAVVLGGGLLGLEAARALAGRGVPVTVVHPVGHLMEQQLDPLAGHVLARALGRLGVVTRVGMGAAAVVGTDRVRALELADGTQLACDLLVVACGVRPRVELARASGLAVERAILVDDQMRSVTDPRVFAVGECAQHRGQVYGLVAPAWEQALVAAAVLTGGARASYPGSRVVARLKAAGVDLAALGETSPVPGEEDEDVQVVQYADAARGTYKKLVLRNDRVVGAILIGDGATVGEVVQLFDRGTPVPRDPMGLLFAGLAAPAAPAAATIPDAATVCHCNAVTKAQLITSWSEGHRSLPALAAATRATTGCGTCRSAVEGVCDWLAARDAALPERPPVAPERRWPGEDGALLPLIPAQREAEPDVPAAAPASTATATT